MTLNANMVELLAEWCAKDDSLADIRAAARRDFFGYNEPGEAHYLVMSPPGNGAFWVGLPCPSNYLTDEVLRSLPHVLS